VIEPFNLWFYFICQIITAGLVYLKLDKTETDSKTEKADTEETVTDEVKDEFNIEEFIPEVNHIKIWEDIENESFDLFDDIPTIPVHTKRETFGYINRLCEDITKFRKNNPDPIHPNEKEVLNQIRLLKEVMVGMKNTYNANPKLIEQRVHYIMRLIDNA
jgi:hypothetical protein